MSEKCAYMQAAINDCQAVIRAIDVKAGFMFVLLLSPLYNIDRYGQFFRAIFAGNICENITIYAILVIWILAVYSLFMCVVAISNPVSRVSGGGGVGTYFGGYLFSFSTIDAFINLNRKSSRSIADDINLLPSDEKAMLSELVFERIKLSYVRDVKMKRIQVCFKLTLLGVILVATEIFYNFLKGV